MWTPTIARLPDGRPHLQHGPIDLVLGADGSETAVAAAFARAEARFPDILPTLAEELTLLRRPVGAPPRGPVAQRMRWACLPFSDQAFITPMAAVAGAVADEMLAAMLADGGAAALTKAYVNDGGDVAFHLAGDATFTAGLVANDETLEAAGTATLDAASPGRGIATSGRGGRSLSLGIADAVTVLADNAALADAAATLIANAVDVDHPAVRRRPAVECDPDSDLGELLAVVAVDPLPAEAVGEALAAGVARAALYRAQGLIHGAALSLAGERRLVGLDAARQIETTGSVPA